MTILRSGKPDDGCRQRILVGSTTGISAATVITRSLFSIGLATWTHTAEDWQLVLGPVVERYRARNIRRYFRGDAAFAKPEILEAEGYIYVIRLPTNPILQKSVAHLLTRPVGRPPNWRPGKLCPRVGFIVTNLSRSAERVTKLYNSRGTAEQYIKEGKNAINWTRLSCHSFRNNEARLQLHALACNLGNRWNICP